MFQGVPWIMIFTTMLAAPALGIAQAAVEAYRERLETRGSALMSGKQSENATSQIALGRATEQAAMARDVLMGAVNDFQHRAEAGDTFTAEDRIGHRFRMAEMMRSGKSRASVARDRSQTALRLTRLTLEMVSDVTTV